jgi:spermidine synthase
VLVLGFAGGSVARVARALAPQATIVGVEKDREVLAVARRDLAIDELGVELVVDDAVAFLRYERRTFDAIVEDVIIGSVRSVRRPAHLLEHYQLLAHRVARGGVLVANTIHDTPTVARLLARHPGTLVSLGVKDYYNHVLALGPAGLRATELRRTLRASPILKGSLPAFNIRTLRP